MFNFPVSWYTVVDEMSVDELSWNLTIYTSKCAQMDPQQLPKTSKLYSRGKKCDLKTTLGGWVPPLAIGSSKVKRV